MTSLPVNCLTSYLRWRALLMLCSHSSVHAVLPHSKLHNFFAPWACAFLADHHHHHHYHPRIPPPTHCCAGVLPGLPKHLQHAGQPGGQLLHVEGGGGGDCGRPRGPGQCSWGRHLNKTAEDLRESLVVDVLPPWQMCSGTASECAQVRRRLNTKTTEDIFRESQTMDIRYLLYQYYRNRTGITLSTCMGS